MAYHSIDIIISLPCTFHCSPFLKKIQSKAQLKPLKSTWNVHLVLHPSQSHNVSPAVSPQSVQLTMKPYMLCFIKVLH